MKWKGNLGPMGRLSLNDVRLTSVMGLVNVRRCLSLEEGRVRRIVTILIVILTCAGLSCGPAMYSHHILRASGALAQAEEADAEELAPYEYHYADEHLKQARREVGHSDFSAAVKCAKIATEYGNKAIEIANRRRREEGR